jgi:hypothetical protein
MEKYGFIYLWFDKRYKRFYIGRHWGTEDDGYVCSSTTMREAHRRRPNDFKRRILKRIHTSKEDLILEEQRWLDMISPNECGKKYYNKTLKSSTPSTRGYKHSKETIEKIRQSNKLKVVSVETKEKLRQANKLQFQDDAQREIRRQKSNELWSDDKYRQRQTDAHKGKVNGPHSDSTKNKIRDKMIGRKFSPETIEKMRIAAKNRKCNNGN